MKLTVNDGEHAFDPAEAQFLARLRQHPELLARFPSILELTHTAEGLLQTADEVEARLIQELRQLGHASMNQWATRAGQRVSDELKSSDATVRRRKKTRTGWCVFGLVSVRDRVWRNQNQNYRRPLPERLGINPCGRSRRLDRVLTDFGSEHCFARAAGGVLEHHGFEIGSTRCATRWWNWPGGWSGSPSHPGRRSPGAQRTSPCAPGPTQKSGRGLVA